MKKNMEKDFEMNAEIAGNVETDLLGLLKTSGSLPQNSLTNRIFEKSMPLIKSMARRYQRLDNCTEQADFINAAYLAVHTTLAKYQTGSSAKISTVLVWYLQKEMEKLCTSADKQVNLTYPDGHQVLMSYRKFQKIKRSLPKEVSYVVSSRFVPLDTSSNHNEDIGFNDL